MKLFFWSLYSEAVSTNFSCPRIPDLIRYFTAITIKIAHRYGYFQQARKKIKIMHTAAFGIDISSANGFFSQKLVGAVALDYVT